MTKVIADITMSLDGFVTGRGADERHGLGDAPEPHTWVMQQARAAVTHGSVVIMGGGDVIGQGDARTSRNAVHPTYERM